MSDHIMDNFKIVEWCRIEECSRFNNIPFGIYAITEPMDTIPDRSVIPYHFEKTVYIGKSGLSYNDFFYDRKKVDTKSRAIGDKQFLTEREYYHRYGLPARRLKHHKHSLIHKNERIKREASYAKFFESFGSGKEVVSKVNVCLIVPDQEIPNHCVPGWLAAMESYFILKFQLRFGRNTLMNIDHDIDNKSRIIENSLASKKREDFKSASLYSFC